MPKKQKKQNGAEKENSVEIKTGIEHHKIEPLKFSVKKLLTLPLWKWVDGKEKFFKPVAPIRLSKQVKSIAKDGKAMETPAHVGHVINLENNMECELIYGTMLRTTLDESYPGDAYVGRCFCAKQYKIEGKRWRGYAVSEIEV